jgi:hypothetical protein
VLFCDMLDQLARDPAKMEGMKVGPSSPPSTPPSCRVMRAVLISPAILHLPQLNVRPVEQDTAMQNFADRNGRDSGWEMSSRGRFATNSDEKVANLILGFGTS